MRFGSSGLRRSSRAILALVALLTIVLLLLSGLHELRAANEPLCVGPLQQHGLWPAHELTYLPVSVPVTALGPSCAALLAPRAAQLVGAEREAAACFLTDRLPLGHRLALRRSLRRLQERLKEADIELLLDQRAALFSLRFHGAAAFDEAVAFRLPTAQKAKAQAVLKTLCLQHQDCIFRNEDAPQWRLDAGCRAETSQTENVIFQCLFQFEFSFYPETTVVSPQLRPFEELLFKSVHNVSDLGDSQTCRLPAQGFSQKCATRVLPCERLEGHLPFVRTFQTQTQGQVEVLVRSGTVAGVFRPV